MEDGHGTPEALIRQRLIGDTRRPSEMDYTIQRLVDSYARSSTIMTLAVRDE